MVKFAISKPSSFVWVKSVCGMEPQSEHCSSYPCTRFNLNFCGLGSDQWHPHRQLTQFL